MPRTRSQATLLKKQARSHERLPIELQTQIITYLKDIDPRSLLVLARVSKSLYYQCSDHIYYEVKLNECNRRQFHRGLDRDMFFRVRRELKSWYNNQHQPLLFGQSTTLRRLLLFDKVHRVIIEDGFALERVVDIATDVARERYFISPSSYMKEKPQALFETSAAARKACRV